LFGLGLMEVIKRLIGFLDAAKGALHLALLQVFGGRVKMG
jgi:hypothetical protein